MYIHQDSSIAASIFQYLSWDNSIPAHPTKLAGMAYRIMMLRSFLRKDKISTNKTWSMYKHNVSVSYFSVAPSVVFPPWKPNFIAYWYQKYQYQYNYTCFYFYHVYSISKQVRVLLVFHSNDVFPSCYSEREATIPLLKSIAEWATTSTPEWYASLLTYNSC